MSCASIAHPSFPTLTHHKDCKTTPNYLRGDTSTDTVLNALTASGGWEPMRVASKVTCNHASVPAARRPPEIFLFSAPDDARPNPATDPRGSPRPLPNVVRHRRGALGVGRHAS